MKYRLNIVKTYLLDKSFEESFSKLQDIVGASFYDSKYSLFGNYFLTEPPDFILMAKWASIGRPVLSNVFSTKISAKLYKLDNKTKIILETSTNPIFFVFLGVCIISVFVQLIKYQGPNDLKMIVGYLLGAIFILGLDRFVKNIVIASFEEDTKIRVPG